MTENWTKKRASRLQGLDIIASNAQGERLRGLQSECYPKEHNNKKSSLGSATSLKQSFAETMKSNQPCFDVQRQGRAKFDFNSAVSSRRCTPYVMDSCGVRELHHYSLKSLRHVLHSTFSAHGKPIDV